MYTDKELEEISAFITIPLSQSELQGVKVSHGTPKENIQSIVSFGPLAKLSKIDDYTPQGLCLVFEEDAWVADYYARLRSGSGGKQGVVLEGILNPSRDCRIANLVLNKSGREVNFKEATLPKFWTHNNQLCNLIQNNYDVVIINCIDQEPIPAKKFLVVQESAGKNIVHWYGYRPVLVPERVQLGFKAAIPSYISPRANPTIVESKYLPKVILIDEKNLIKRFEVAGRNIVEFNPSTVPYYSGKLKIKNLESPIRTLTGPKAITAGNMASAIMLGRNLYTIYQQDSKDRNQVFVVFGINGSLDLGVSAVITKINSPASLLINTLSFVGTIIPPDQAAAQMQTLIKHMDSHGLDASPSSRFALGSFLVQYVSPLLNRGWDKIGQISHKIAESKTGQATAKFIAPSLGVVWQVTQAIDDSFRNKEALRLFSLGSPEGNCFFLPPIQVKPKKQKSIVNSQSKDSVFNESELLGFNGEEKFQQTLNVNSTCLFNGNQAFILQQFSEVEKFDLLFQAINPQPSTLPTGVDSLALNFESNFDRSNRVITASELSNPYFGGTLLLSANPVLNPKSVMLHSQSTVMIPIEKNSNISTQNAIIKKTSSNPIIAFHEKQSANNYMISWTTAGLTAAVAVKQAGITSVVVGQNLIGFSAAANFGPQFWAVLGMSCGIGAAIAAPIAIGQYFYYRHLKKLAEKTKCSLKHSNKNMLEVHTQYNELVSSLNSTEDHNYSHLFKLSDEALQSVQQNVTRELRRAKEATKRKHKEAAKIHTNLIVENYVSTFWQLMKLNHALKLEKTYDDTFSANEQKSPEEILGSIKSIIACRKLAPDQIQSVEALRSLLLDKTKTLALKGEEQRASALMAEATQLSYYKMGSILPFSYSASENNNRGLGSFRGTVQSELARHADNINKDVIGEGLNPVHAINKVLAHINDKIRHYKNKDKNIVADLVEYRQHLSEIRDSYQQKGNLESNLQLDEYSEFYSGYARQLSNKTSQFLYSELEKLHNGSSEFTSESKEVKQVVENYVESKLKQTVCAEIISNNINGEFAKSRNALQQFKAKFPDDKLEINNLLSITDFCEDNQEKPEEFWFAYHPNSKEEKSNEVNESEVAYNINLQRSTANLKLINFANEKSTTLGFHYHAAATLKRLYELEPIQEIKNKALEFENLDLTQTRTALFKPVQSMTTRFIQGLEPSSYKTILSKGLSACHVIQSIIPNFWGYALQGVEALRDQNNLFEYKSYIGEVKNKFITDIKNPSSKEGALLWMNFALILSGYSFENLLPKTLFGYNIAKLTSTSRILFLIQVQRLLRLYALYQAIQDLSKFKGASASSILSFATLLQATISGISWGYERYRSYVGNSIEDPSYYRNKNLVHTFIDNAASTCQMTLIRNPLSLISLGLGVLSFSDFIYAALARTSRKESIKEALTACLCNLDHYQALKKDIDSSLLKSKITNYLESVNYSIGNFLTDHLQSVKSGEEIIIQTNETVTYLYIRKNDNDYEMLEMNISESLPLGNFKYDQLDSSLQEDIKKLVIYSAEKETINQMESLVKAIGLRYQSDEDPILNSARVSILESRLNQLLVNKQYQAVVDSSNINEDQKTLHPEFRLPLTKSINVILKRLAAIASDSKLIHSFHLEYEIYIHKLSEIRSDNEEYWEECINQFKLQISNVLQNLLMRTKQEEDIKIKQKYLELLIQNYSYCGDWHTLLSDEYKLLAGYCSYLHGNIKECRNFTGDIKDIEGLLREKKTENFSKLALVLISATDEERYSNLLRTANYKDCAITPSLLNSMANDMIENKQYADAIEWLHKTKHFPKQGYFLAVAYYMQDQDNLFLPLHALAIVTEKDFSYWTFYHLLLNNLMTKAIAIHPELPSSALTKLMTMYIVCCEQLLTHNINHHDACRFRTVSDHYKKQLRDIITKQNAHNLFFSHQSSSEKVNSILLKVRQWMLGLSQLSVHKQKIKSIFETLSLSQNEIDTRFELLEMPNSNQINLKGLMFQPIAKDGHCLYRAVSFYLGKTVQELREVVANHLLGNQSCYRDFIELTDDETIESYCRKIINTNQFATHVEIKILSDIYARPIVILDNNLTIRNPYLDFESAEPIFLLFDDHLHYDALLLTGQLSGQEILTSLLVSRLAATCLDEKESDDYLQCSLK
jgi:hypothetical protein